MTTLRLSKSYVHRRLEGHLTVEGLVRLPVDEVQKFKEDMRQRRVSTIDPRIEWEDDVDLAEKEWEYEDWSFGIIDEDEA